MTVLADAVSYLLSAAGIRAIGGSEPRPGRGPAPGARPAQRDGWATCSTGGATS